MATKKKVAPPLDLSAPPPFSMEAEACMLGSLLMDQTKVYYPTALSTVKPDDLYLPPHKICYEQLIKLYEEGKTVDLVTFTQHMSDVNLITEIGGAGFITGLFSIVPSGSNIKSYIEIIKDKALLRQASDLCREALTICQNEQSHFPELLSTLSKFLHLEKFSWNVRKTMMDLVKEIMEKVESDKPEEDVLRTYITLLDMHVKIRHGDYVVIKGQTKFGKSILATTIMGNHCVKELKPALYISLESPMIEIMNRLFAGVSRIPMNDMHISKLTQDQMNKVAETGERLGKTNMILRDDLFDIHSIVAAIRECKQHHPDLSMVIVDYIQLVKSFLGKTATRQQEIAAMSRSLRRLSMELKLPVIVLSQENAEGRTREAADLEQDATAILKISLHEDQPDTRRVISITQRNGASNQSFDLAFLGHLGRMENLSARDMAAN